MNKLFSKKSVSILLILLLAFTYFPLNVRAYANLPDSGSMNPTISNNKGRNAYIYDNWSQTVKSYLYKDGSNLIRVENIGDKVIVEQYDSSYNLIGYKDFMKELPIWGGFFHGDNFNYIVYGKTNPNEDNNSEIVRIVKYDENFNKISHTSVYGNNTTVPFDAGSLRMAQKNNMINILTSHEMYKSSDGYNHQSNMFIQYDEQNEVITNVNSSVSYVGTGYVSHSFNQFIITDSSGNMITVNHGDAYPRAVTLHRFTNSVKSTNEYVEVVKFAGAVGENFTGFNLGGLVETDNSYLIVGSKNPNTSKEARGLSKNVELYSVSKSNLKDINTYTISNYDELVRNGGASTPFIVKDGSNNGYILWNEKGTGNLSFAAYYPDGSIGGETRVSAPAYLSDCQPIMVDGHIVWYMTDGVELIFYILNPQTGKLYTNLDQPEIPPVNPIYEISANPNNLDFGEITEGNNVLPKRINVTITNLGNTDITMNRPYSNNFDITNNSSLTISPQSSIVFSISPKLYLREGQYNEEIVFSGTNGVNTSVQAKVVVKNSKPTKVLEPKFDVIPTKNWTIKFNRPIDASSVNGENIKVIRQDGVEEKIRLVVTNNGDSVLVAPETPFIQGYTYKLIIKDIKSGQVELRENIEMEFTIR